MEDQAGSAILWRRRSGDDIVWAAYGDACVVYHRPSGITHMLNDATVRLLTEILREPASFARIAAAFSDANASLPAAEFTARLQEMLARLEHFGLVERARPEPE